MRFSKLIVILGLCLLLALAGCGEPISPEAEIDLENVSGEGEQIRFVGNVTLDGGSYNTTIHNVRLRFVAENGSRLRTVDVGTLTVNDSQRFKRVRFNVTVAKSPEALRLRIGTINTPEGVGFTVWGLKLNDEEELLYSPKRQNEY